MIRPPAVIALDIDGTLFDGSGVAAGAVRAVCAAVAAGYTVVLVTGRSWRDLPIVVPEILPHVALAACEEGATMVEPATGRWLHVAAPLDAAVVHGFVGLAGDAANVGDVVVSGPAALADAAERLVVHHGSAAQVVRNKDSVALVPAGCDKGAALRAAVAALGLAGAPVLAVGDAANDLPMFAVADVAVAVANADGHALAAATSRTTAPFGDGVAEAFARFLHLDPVVSEPAPEPSPE